MLLIKCEAGYFDQNPSGNDNYGGNQGGHNDGGNKGGGKKSKDCPWSAGMDPDCANGQCTLR